MASSSNEVKAGRDVSPATILYLHSSDDLYGADVILLKLVTGLDRSRYKPIVILPADMKQVGLLSAELTKREIEWMHLPLAIVRRRYLRPPGLLHFAVNLLRSTLAIRAIARRNNVRLIHGFTLAVASAPAAAAMLRLPLVMHAHEILERPILLRRVLHTLAVRWSRRVICVSAATRRNILEDQPSSADRVCVIHNGIDLPATPHRSIDEIKSELGVPPNKPLVGMIGRVSAWKGQGVFLEAAALLIRQNVDCHFIAIGGVFDNEVRHQDRLNELYARLELKRDVTLKGFMPNAREVLAAFDIFILPSTQPDPFPTVILEAMSAGIPVIATAHGGPLEMVVDGETGLLVPPGDPAALAAAIELLLLDAPKRKAMGDAGRRRIENEFALDTSLNRVQQVYSATLCNQA